MKKAILLVLGIYCFINHSQAQGSNELSLKYLNILPGGKLNQAGYSEGNGVELEYYHIFAFEHEYIDFSIGYGFIYGKSGVIKDKITLEDPDGYTADYKLMNDHFSFDLRLRARFGPDFFKVYTSISPLGYRSFQSWETIKMNNPPEGYISRSTESINGKFSFTSAFGIGVTLAPNAPLSLSAGVSYYTGGAMKFANIESYSNNSAGIWFDEDQSPNSNLTMYNITLTARFGSSSSNTNKPETLEQQLKRERREGRRKIRQERRALEQERNSYFFYSPYNDDSCVETGSGTTSSSGTGTSGSSNKSLKPKRRGCER